jgi:hypothetical protein
MALATTKYRFTVAPGKYLVPGFGEVDLLSMPVEVADRMFAKGIDILQLKPVKEAPAPVPEVKEIRRRKNAAK